MRENLTQKGSSIDPGASSTGLESDIKLLREEIRALHWLARRKEQEWDNVIRLLKQKEERLLRSERQYSLGSTDYRASQNLCDLANQSLARNSDDNIMSSSMAEMNTKQLISTGKKVGCCISTFEQAEITRAKGLFVINDVTQVWTFLTTPLPSVMLLYIML